MEHPTPSTLLAPRGIFSDESYEPCGPLQELPAELLKGQDDGLVSDEINKSWSSDLMAKHPGSRWITYRHNRLLVRGNKDGTGQVIFAANPAFEHLRIVPKTHPEYEKLKAEMDAKKAKKAEKQAEKEAAPEKPQVTDEQLQQAKENASNKRMATKQVNQEFATRVAEILGRPELAKKDLDKAEQRADKVAAGELVPTRSSIDPELKKLAEAPEHKEKVTRAVEQLAQQQLVEQELEARLGVPPSEPATTGVPALDQALKRTKLSQEDAMAILTARDARDQAKAAIKEEFKDDLKPTRAEIAINNLQGVGITDWTQGVEPHADAVLEKALKREESRIRATMNADFYQVLDGREGSRETQRMISDGARSSLNAVAGQVLEGAEFSKDMLEFLGTQNASVVIANRVFEAGKERAASLQKDLEDVFVSRAQDVVSTTLQQADVRTRNMQAYRNLQADGTIAAGTAAANNARQLRELGRAVGLAAGSLEASATVIDCLRQPDLVSGDVVADGGKDLGKLKTKLRDLGIDEAQAKITLGENDRYQVRIAPEHFAGLMTNRKSASYQREQAVADIKSGAANEEGWLPKGAAQTIYDFKTPQQHSKLADKTGWESYTNTPGQPGYTSQFPTGTPLFRKGMPARYKDAQQEMVKFALTQKRAVWDAGAGIGKTASFLAVMSELKETGKLKGSFAVMAPPSRLRDEFFKDRDKFFPNLRVLELDKIKGLDKKKEALDRAKAGEFDVVLTGHDSVKSGTSKAESEAYAKQKMEELREQRRGEGRVLGLAETKAKRAQFLQEAATGLGVPALLASYKPAFVGVDEAHEAFQFNEGGKGDSQRFNAIKQLAASTEHFLPATGTTVRNHIGELGTILHITRPDILKDPRKFAAKYATLGQSSAVFQGDAINDFRREFDNIMISRATKIDAKLHEKEQRVQLTDQQRAGYKQNEKQYRLDREAKGYGVIDTRDGTLHFATPDSLTEYSGEQLGFKPNDAVMSQQERKFLQEKGFDGPHFRIKKLGVGASARRDSLHDRTLNGGDWQTNAKAQALLQHMKDAPHEAVAVSYESKASLAMLRQALQEGHGLKPDQIVHIDGSLSAAERNATVTRYQSDPNVKAILLSPAGRTGLNLQKIDTIYHLTRPNTYAEQVQTNARSWRTGRGSDVRAIYLDSDTPYDNNRVDTVKRKQKTASTVGEYQAQPGLAATAARARQQSAQQAAPELVKAQASDDILGELLAEVSGRRQVLANRLNGLEKGLQDETDPLVDGLLESFGQACRHLRQVEAYRQGLPTLPVVDIAVVGKLLLKGLEIIPFSQLNVRQAAPLLDHLAARHLQVATPDGQTHTRPVWIYSPPPAEPEA